MSVLQCRCTFHNLRANRQHPRAHYGLLLLQYILHQRALDKLSKAEFMPWFHFCPKLQLTQGHMYPRALSIFLFVTIHFESGQALHHVLFWRLPWNCLHCTMFLVGRVLVDLVLLLFCWSRNSLIKSRSCFSKLLLVCKHHRIRSCLKRNSLYHVMLGFSW